VWTNPVVFKHLQNDFVMLELYVDEKIAQLPANEVYTSTYSGKQVTTVGGKNSDYETVKFQTNSQPYYVIIDSNGNTLVPPQGANFSVDNYIKYLESGLAAYKSKQ
jgi:thiol:disulfide interchange protein DsbD